MPPEKRFKSDLNVISQYINQLDFFVDMGIAGNDLLDLVELMTYTFFKKDEIIISTHGPQEFMYFVLDGAVSFKVDYEAKCF